MNAVHERPKTASAKHDYRTREEPEEPPVGLMERRLKPILDAGAVEGEPDYWYGVVDGYSGALWSQLYVTQSDAARCAKELEGHVVIIAARILEDRDGEHIEPGN